MLESPSVPSRVKLEVHDHKENYENDDRTQRALRFSNWRIPRVDLDCCATDDDAVVETEVKSN